MYDCYCDDDPAEFLNVSIHKARKQYRCDECPGTIRPGDQYEYVFGKWDGYTSTFHICRHCRDLRTWAQINIPCLCWLYGNADESIADAIEAACHRAPEETIGLRFGFLRRKVLRDRHNRSSSASV